MLKKPYISVIGSEGIDILHIKDIIYIYSKERTVNFVLESTPNIKKANCNIGVLEKMLVAHDQLIRCHNRYIVNIDKISCIKNGSSTLLLNDNIEVPISKTYRENFKEKIGNFCIRLHC